MTGGGWREVLRTSATWAAALATLGGLIFIVILATTRRLGVYQITSLIIWQALVIWMLWLTLTVLGHHERIDEARDDATQARTDVADLRLHLDNVEAPSGGRHAARKVAR